VCRSWGNGGHLGSRRTWPARKGKRRAVGIGQWRRIDIAGCVKTQEAGSSQHQATFTHRVSVIVHCIIIVTSKNHNRNSVLLYYLFQEYKSFGSKTPFAFILWCTGSCVEHTKNYQIFISYLCLSIDISYSPSETCETVYFRIISC
jgi:hypothetical protein